LLSIQSKFHSMKPLILVIIFFFISIINVAAQQLSGIVNAYAFFQTRFKGNIFVDDNGNQGPGSDTIRFIYLEQKSLVMPKINTVAYKGKLYSASLFEVPKREIKIGNRLINGKSVLLKATAGNRLWKIELSPPPAEVQTCAKGYQNKILINGEKNGSPFIWTINYDTELRAEVTY